MGRVREKCGKSVWPASMGLTVSSLGLNIATVNAGSGDVMHGYLLANAITAFLGFLINGAVLFLVLSRGRKKYHFLFGAFLFAIAIWDIGIFLIMVRNNSPNEMPIYGTVVLAVCAFLPAFIYSFTHSYLNQPRKKLEMLIWGLCIICSLVALSQVFKMGVCSFGWGNFVRLDSVGLVTCAIWFVLFYFSTLSSSWSLFHASRKEPSHITRRHIQYTFISLLVISLASTKAFVIYGIDNPALIPAGILLTDIFGALIGIAIVKYRLLDITIIIKKATIYSALVAIIIFIFSLSEHMLATYVGEFFGGHSIFIHIISIAVVIAILMPVRHKIERAIEGFFARKKVEF